MSLRIASEVHPDRYILSCHCMRNVLALSIPGAEKLDPLKDFSNVISCDCSHCCKRRAIWYYAKSEDVEFVKGGSLEDGDLKEYQFGTKWMSQRFCPDCGTHLLGQPVPHAPPEYHGLVGINVRALRNQDIDLRTLPTKPGSTKFKGGIYAIHNLPDGAEAYLKKRAEHYSSETKIYTGGCHCGKITYGVLSAPLETTDIVDCNCSVCGGNCVLWAFPGRKDIYFHPHLSDKEPWQPDLSLVTRYLMKEKPQSIHYHTFCNECGIQIYQSEEADMKEGEECWAEDLRKGMFFGFNVATINDADELISGDGIKERLKGYVLNNWAAKGDPYIVKI